MPEKFSADVVIAGAGIVGLATAYQLLSLRPALKIRILEKENGPALHQSGRNSGVVHTGIYYKPGSLKAKNCIEGRAELLSFCDRENVPYQTIHKLIVATTKQETPRLHEIFNRGQANGVPGIALLSRDQTLEIEPCVNALEAIWVPKCHIIQYNKVALALCTWIQNRGGEIIFNEPVIQIKSTDNVCEVVTKNKVHKSHYFINCTGLHSDQVAAATSSDISHKIMPFRGEYYELTQEKSKIVRGLIYPTPDPRFPFLGVHLTPMLNGKVEAGPNAILAFAREGYRKRDIDLNCIAEMLAFPGFWKMASKYWKAGIYEIARSMSKRLFLRDLQRLVPSIEGKDLIPGGAGIRAQVVTKDGKLLDDFAFLQQKNILHVLNAPSPAATASFSIGKTLAQMIIGSYE